LKAFAAAGTDAHRICSSADAWVERFGEDLLLSYKDDAARDQLAAQLPEWENEHGQKHRRIFSKYIPLKNDERIAPVLIEGDAALPLETTVTENGLRFGLDFAAGYSAGLFIDQRANRSSIRRVPVRRLLNTFAYTCSFSVVAALSGAETVSIDLSRKSLDRGRANFALNAIDPSAHRFLADDVLDVLPRLARRGETFDAIILDPPTFSRGNKGRRFQIERDFEALLQAALEVAAPRARILLSTNCTRLTRRELERIARFALKLGRRAANFHAEPALPDIPSEFAAQTLWVTLK
jgi:23S rRNA (cytosine1962-C5)-methyltransferase